MMDDLKLERIALNQISDLPPEVQEIIKAEILSRGLNENILSGIDAQSEELTPELINELKGKLIGVNCPSCGESNEKLMGGVIKKVRSYLIVTTYEERPIIVCPNCLTAKRKKEILKTSLLGWWGFPWGLLYRTPKTIIMHIVDSNDLHNISENVLQKFVVSNLGEIKANMENKEELTELIGFHNQKI